MHTLRMNIFRPLSSYTNITLICAMCIQYVCFNYCSCIISVPFFHCQDTWEEPFPCGDRLKKVQNNIRKKQNACCSILLLHVKEKKEKLNDFNETLVGS